MRRKFFVIIFLVLSITAFSISAIHFHFFQVERLRLIHLNLQQNATLLTNSDLNLSKGEFTERGEEMIQDLIGDDKVNMVVAIYGSKGKLLYKNENAYVFEVSDEIGADPPEWEDVETKEYLIKYLNVKDPKQDRIIKVGMILNQSLLRWKDLNQRISVYVLIILAVVTVISFFLTYLLFKPVHRLAEQVNLMALKVEQGELTDLKSWFTILNKNKSSKDEFTQLVGSLDRLADKIMDSQAHTKKWSSLMAHELKTPMTILRNSIDRLMSHNNIGPQEALPVEEELHRLEEIVTDFLEWASLENDPSRPEIHVIPLQKRLNSLIGVIQNSYPESEITLLNSSPEERKIFCNPIHFDQVFRNLIINGIKYSDEKKVEVTITQATVVVRDFGPGISDPVLKNFGNPFNKAKHQTQEGYGLGLAWVNTVVKKYGWAIHFDNKQGTIVTVTIRENDELS